jgi:hypothetical protein
MPLAAPARTSDHPLASPAHLARGRARLDSRAGGIRPALAGAVLFAVLLAGGPGQVGQAARFLAWRLAGVDRVAAEAIGARARLAPERFAASHPALRADPADPAAAILPRGVHDLTRTLVVPVGARLRIEAGAVLRFAAGRSLVAYGPVEARGTLEAPVVLGPLHPWLPWGALVMVGAGPSVLEHVRVERARWARVDGVDYPGSLSFAEASVRIEQSAILGSTGKDALHVRGGDLVARGNRIEGAARDGLDVDGATGLVFANRFVDCGDEGIDLSGAVEGLVVEGNEVLDARGGRLAAESGLERLRAHNRTGYSNGTPRIGG